jgi:hypothetical protein
MKFGMWSIRVSPLAPIRRDGIPMRLVRCGTRDVRVTEFTRSQPKLR